MNCTQNYPVSKSIFNFCQFSVFLVFIFFISGCAGPGTVNKWVAKQYDASQLSQPKKTSDWVAITSSLVNGDVAISHTESNTSNMLPLLFYWQFNYSNTCTINPAIPVNNFTATIIPYAAKKGLKQKLNGQRVELSLDSLPNTFVLNDKARIIWIIYAFGWDYMSIRPQTKNLVVTYRVLQGNTETKRGTITVTDTDKGIALGRFDNTKKKTLEYLEGYDATIADMGRQVIDKLMTEL